MMCKISGVHLLTLITIKLLVTICSAQLDTNPADNDPKILKQPPHHWGTPAPDSGLKLDFVPFRVLASVRREQSTKYLPRDAALAQASTPEEIILAKRLRESITTKKLGEVYTEQGYEDKKYDHGFHDKHGDFKEKYEKFDKANSSSTKAPLYQQVNKKDKITRPVTKKKVQYIEKPIDTNSKHQQGATEYIAGMLPPPMPRQRYTRDLRPRQVYSTRRGGVKFTSGDLDGDGSEIDVASIVTAHRVSPDSKYGVRETESRRSPENARGRELRSRSKHYEVTELPEEQLPSHNNRFSSRGTSRRTNDQSKIKEKVYSSTYIPRTNLEEELAPEITTNALGPEVTPRYKIEQEEYNNESQQRDIVTEVPYKPEFIVPTTSRGQDSGRSRTRSRPPVASISEDVFQGRGERRKSEPHEKTNSELLRSRNRQVRIKNVENAKPVEISTPEQISLDVITQEPEAFIIPTENIPVINNEPTESIEIPTEKIPVERHNTRQRPTPEAGNNTPQQQERVPSERRIPSERQRNTERQHNSERQQNSERQFNSERQPTSERQQNGRVRNTERQPTSERQSNSERQPTSERQSNSERQPTSERQSNSERQPTSERQSNVERQPSGRKSKRPITEATNIQDSLEPTTPRVVPSRIRSSTRRLEAFKAKKQDNAANIDFAPSRHQQSRNSRVSIDPVENIETEAQQVDTRRVNRQGSRRSLDTTGRAEQQQVESAPTSRRNVPRRGSPEPAASSAAAASTRYQFPGKQQTTLYTDDSGRRYLCIVLEDGVDVDQVVVNTKF